MMRVEFCDFVIPFSVLLSSDGNCGNGCRSVAQALVCLVSGVLAYWPYFGSE